MHHLVKSTSIATLRATLGILIVTLLSTSALNAQSKVYKKVNADGSISFSDTPIEGSVEVSTENQATNVVPSPANAQANATKILKPTKAINYQLKVVSPASEATIRNNEGKVTIHATVTPEAKGRFDLKIRDKAYSSTSGIFTLEGLERGTYPYQINFSTHSGKVIASSALQRFYLHKASVLIKPQKPAK